MSVLFPIQRLAPYDSWNDIGEHFCDSSDTPEVEVSHYHGHYGVVATPPAPIPAPHKIHRRLSKAEHVRRRFHRMIRVAKHHFSTLRKKFFGEVSTIQETTNSMVASLENRATQTMLAMAEMTPAPVPKREYREVSVLAARLLGVMAKARHDTSLPQNSAGTTVAKQP